MVYLEQRKRKEKERLLKSIPTGILFVLAFVAFISDPVASIRLPLLFFEGIWGLVLLLKNEKKLFLLNLLAVLLVFFPMASSTDFMPRRVERENLVILQQEMDSFNFDRKKTEDEIKRNKADIAVFSIGGLKEDMLRIWMKGIYAHMYAYENEKAGKIIVFMNEKPKLVKELKIDEKTVIALDFVFEHRGRKYHILVSHLPNLTERGGYGTSEGVVRRLMDYIHKENDPFLLIGDFKYPPYTKLIRPVLQEGFKTLLSPKLFFSYRLSDGRTFAHPGFEIAKIRKGIRIGENLPRISVVNFAFETETKGSTLPPSVKLEEQNGEGIENDD